MRNNTNYMQTGVLSALQLDLASSRKSCSRTSTRRAATRSKSGKKDAPFGFVHPAGQRDMTRVAFMVNMLRLQGIEVGRRDGRSEAERGHVPRRLIRRQARSALRAAGEDSARKAELSRSEPADLRRHRLDDGADDATRTSRRSPTKRFSTSPVEPGDEARYRRRR